MKTQTETNVPPLIVDRSPELMRNTHPITFENKWRLLDLPPGEECVRGDGGRCVVAEALKSFFGEGWEPHIEGEQPYITGPHGRRVNLNIDKSVAEAIGKFDRGDPDAFKDLNLKFQWD